MHACHREHRGNRGFKVFQSVETNGYQDPNKKEKKKIPNFLNRRTWQNHAARAIASFRTQDIRHSSCVIIYTLRIYKV
jgi:hypothetical protein